MRVVTQLTGLTADTIRVWERRYGAVVPRRTDGNARRYSPEDVRRLNLLREATERGHAIGEVARLPEPELRRLLATTAPAADGAQGEALEGGWDGEGLDTTPGGEGETLDMGGVADASRENLDNGAAPRPEVGGGALEGTRFGRFCTEYLDTLRRFEVRRGTDLLAACALLLEPREVVFDVILPIRAEVARRIGAGAMSTAHEHVATAQHKSLVSLIARQLPPPPPDAPRVLVATPPGHAQEFGALVAGFVVTAHGHDAIYLGAELSEGDLENALALSDARRVVLSVARPVAPGEAVELARSVRRLRRLAEIWVVAPSGDALTEALRHVEGVTTVDGPAALDRDYDRARR